MYTIYIYVAYKILTAKFVTPSSIVELMADNVENGHSGFDQTPLKRFQALFKSLLNSRFPSKFNAFSALVRLLDFLVFWWIILFSSESTLSNSSVSAAFSSHDMRLECTSFDTKDQPRKCRTRGIQTQQVQLLQPLLKSQWLPGFHFLRKWLCICSSDLSRTCGLLCLTSF